MQGCATRRDTSRSNRCGPGCSWRSTGSSANWTRPGRTRPLSAARRRERAQPRPARLTRRSPSPGVVLRCRLVARPDLVEPREGLVVELDLERPQGIVELFDCPRTDDRSGDTWSRQQPGECDVRRLVSEVVAEVLVRLHLLAVLRQEVLRATFGAPLALALLLEHPAQEAAVQRAPRDDTQPVVLRGGQHLELDLAPGEVVERLLADESGEVSLPRRLLSGGDVPSREVAAAGVEDLALRAQGLHRLPDLLPWRVPVDVVHLVEVDVVGLQSLQ